MRLTWTVSPTTTCVSRRLRRTFFFSLVRVHPLFISKASISILGGLLHSRVLRACFPSVISRLRATSRPRVPKWRIPQMSFCGYSLLRNSHAFVQSEYYCDQLGHFTMSRTFLQCPRSRYHVYESLLAFIVSGYSFLLRVVRSDFRSRVPARGGYSCVKVVMPISPVFADFIGFSWGCSRLSVRFTGFRLLP